MLLVDFIRSVWWDGFKWGCVVAGVVFAILFAAAISKGHGEKNERV